jgi:hypothetical protein
MAKWNSEEWDEDDEFYLWDPHADEDYPRGRRVLDHFDWTGVLDSLGFSDKEVDEFFKDNRMVRAEETASRELFRIMRQTESPNK